MKKFVLILLLAGFVACNSKTPDVSGIAITITTERFEQKLFDTAAGSLSSYLLQLQQANPSFTAVFLNNILNADPAWPADSTATYVNEFIKAYRPVFNTVQKQFGNFEGYEKEIVQALKYCKYYFPAYSLPKKIITYIGPADGYGDIIAPEGLLIGLHHHLGKDDALYKTDLVQQIYPAYISNRFEPATITVNAIRNIVDDMYPDKSDDQPLVNQMIEKGKRLYLMHLLLPQTPQWQLIGYTEQQMNDCQKQEANIWDLFVKNGSLQIADKNIVKNYIGESPKTIELGEGAPGNIGAFAGWQIVKKYMQKNSDVTPQQLMQTTAENIFSAAKYKP
jgi:hypothetical protein